MPLLSSESVRVEAEVTLPNPHLFHLLSFLNPTVLLPIGSLTAEAQSTHFISISLPSLLRFRLSNYIIFKNPTSSYIKMHLHPHFCLLLQDTAF